MNNSELETKQKQFNVAMSLYDNKKSYQLFGKLISTINISMQIFLLYKILPLSIGAGWQVVSLVSAFFLADFINGLVHMYMDNNDNYDSLQGPLIAAFHMHHRTPVYKKNPILWVYFNESGSKIWLAALLMIIAVFSLFIDIYAVVLYTIFYFAVFSTIAEVSHYLCHKQNSKPVDFLAKIGLLLSKKHHGKHHLEDNVNYAFLNGMSDGLINFIAKVVYPGYKNTTDKHYILYVGNDTKNRQTFDPLN